MESAEMTLLNEMSKRLSENKNEHSPKELYDETAFFYSTSSFKCRAFSKQDLLKKFYTPIFCVGKKQRALKTDYKIPWIDRKWALAPSVDN
jgi:hypothetical protein